MIEDDLKVELVKIHFILLGAVLTAVKLEFPRHKPHVVGGTILLSISVSLVYLSLMPGFHSGLRYVGLEDEDDYWKERMDLFVFVSFSSFLFLLLGFGLPVLLSGDAVIKLDFAASRTERANWLPYLLTGILVVLRMFDVYRDESRSFTRLYGLYIGFVLFSQGFVWFVTQEFLQL